MQIVNLYKYIRDDGGVTVSPVKPDIEYTEMFRLIADEDKELINGDIRAFCVDVESTEGWNEIDAPITDDEDDGKTYSGLLEEE